MLSLIALALLALLIIALLIIALAAPQPSRRYVGKLKRLG